MIYMIENGFSDPAREEAWSKWYTHHVTNTFRSVPGWRTGQRFRAIPPSFPKYRAMYTVETADVMRSKEYKATTGGRFPAEWLPCITNFQRNLFDAVRAPAVPMDGCLIVAEPQSANADLSDIPLAWMPCVDLDKSVERRGIAVVSRAKGEEVAKRAIPGLGAYVPIFEQYVI